MFRIPAHIQRNPRSGVFYFRLTVPERLRHIIKLREIKRSLRTGLRADALLFAQKYYYETQLLFKRAEHTMSDKKNDHAPWSEEWIKQNSVWSLGEGESDAESDVDSRQIAKVLDQSVDVEECDPPPEVRFDKNYQIKRKTDRGNERGIGAFLNYCIL